MSGVPRLRLAALAALVTATLAFGVWPGEPNPINRASWAEPGAGLRLMPLSQVLAERQIWSTTGEFSFELWLAPGPIQGPGNREIASFVDGSGVRPLLVGQWPRGFFLRARADNPSGDPRRDRYGDFPARAERHHVAVVGSASRTQLWADGSEDPIALAGPIVHRGAPFGGLLLLGSSGRGWPQWRGRIRAVAFYDRALAAREIRQHARLSYLDQPGAASVPGLRALYLFEERKGGRAKSRVAGAPDLLLPARVEPVDHGVLTFALPPGGGRGWLVRDVALNVLGFAPLGLLIAWGRGIRGLAQATAVGAALSLFIELAQPWIPGRSSSGFDLVCNASGALLGGALALALRRRLRPS